MEYNLTLNELLEINNKHYFDNCCFVDINSKKYSFIKGYLTFLPSKFNHSLYNVKISQCATYIIQEWQNGKLYIGSSEDVYKRIVKHKYSIGCKQHDNINFNKLLKETNINNFELIVIFTNTREEAYDLEQLLIDKYKDTNRLLNIAKDARVFGTGAIFTDAHRKKISDSNLGKITSEKTKRVMSEFHKSDPRAIEQFKKILDAKKRRIMVYGVEYESLTQAGKLSGMYENQIRERANAGDPNIYWLTDNVSPLKGIQLSEDHKRNLSIAKKNSVRSQQQIQEAIDANRKKILLNGVMYNSVLEAVVLGMVPEATIHRYADKTSNPDYYILDYIKPKLYQVSANGIIYENRSIAAKELGISISTLKGRIRSKAIKDYFYIKN